MNQRIEKRLKVLAAAAMLATLYALLQVVVALPLHWGAAVLLAWFGPVTLVCVAGWFFAFGQYRELLEEGGWDAFPWWIQWAIRIFLALFMQFDVYFNFLIGSVVFRDRPRKVLFTARVQHFVDRGGRATTHEQHEAAAWTRRLNLIHPKHIKAG